jgi:hypothetical protein
MPNPFTSPLVDLAFLLFPTLWIGLLAGVCFVATPAKFQASSLSRPVALDVGRSTFAIWNNVEWTLLAVMIPLLAYPRGRLDSILAMGAVGILLLIQTMVLLPVLNGRVVTIMAGGRPEASTDHLIYIVMDVLKVGVLGSIVWKEAGRLVPLLLHPH